MLFVQVEKPNTNHSNGALAINSHDDDAYIVKIHHPVVVWNVSFVFYSPLYGMGCV